MTRPYYLELLVKYRCQTASKRIEDLGLQATNALQSAALGLMTEGRVKRDRSKSGNERKGKQLHIGSHLSRKPKGSVFSAFERVRTRPNRSQTQ
jgi:hypothetical protein